MKKRFVLFWFLVVSPAFGVFNNDMPNACGSFSDYIYAVFQPKSYTCNEGYFLPANTLGCEPCPVGHTCNGGVFDFNPTISQGIIYTKTISNNAAKSCSVNFSKYNVAKFVPRIINLNFDDGNGNTTTTTCTYGDTVTIPETEPTRTGYVFTGWVVRSE